MRGCYLLWLVIHHLVSVPGHLDVFRRHNLYKRFLEQSSSESPQKCLPAMITKPGLYHLTFISDLEPCRSFLLAPPDHVIEFSIIKSNVDCETGYVALFDGMRTSRVSFPNDDMEWEEFCDVTEAPTPALRTSSNVGMVGYHVTRESGRIDLEIQFVANPSPCDMVVVADVGTMDLENSKMRNCSVLLLNSKVIHVTEMNIGKKKRRYFRQQPFQSSECTNRRDNLEILGGSDVGENYMDLYSRFCGRIDRGLNDGIVIPVHCPYAMVKLISSGTSSNRAKIEWKTKDTEYDERCL